MAAGGAADDLRVLEMAPGLPENTFLTMRPLEIDESLEEDGDQRQMNSARVAALRQEAELRAEHQAMARETMLCLSQALEQSRDQIRELTRLLQDEQECCAGFRRRCEKLEADLGEALEAEEKRKAEELLKRGFASGNKLFINMMLSKSREAYESDLFSSAASTAPTRADTEATQRFSGPESSTQRSCEMEGTSAGHTSEHDSGHQHRDTSLKRHDGPDVRSLHAGDRVTFTWILKLWLREANISKEKTAADSEEAERGRLRSREEEQRLALEDEIEKRVGEMRNSVKFMQSQLDTANQAIEESRKRSGQLEKQLEASIAEAQEREQQHEVAMMKLHEEQLQLQHELANKEGKIQRLKQLHEEAQAAFRRAEAEHNSEKKQLQDTIRRISSELQEAVVLAKYMRETLLKCKRDASSSISPAKFAELIVQLETTRDSLKALQRKHDQVKASNSDLHLKLEKNRRSLELERQFLPLIRQARGPLGRTDVTDVLTSPPALPEVRGPGKLQRSRSVSDISRDHALSGAAGGS